MNKLEKEELLNLNSSVKAYKYLFSQIYNLGKQICKLKNLEYSGNTKEEELESMAEEIYYESFSFELFYNLQNELSRWDNTKERLEEKKIHISTIYNNLVDEINSYNDVFRQIKQEGFENLKKKADDELRNALNIMLEYKKRKFDKNASLIKLLEEIDLCYHDLHWIYTTTFQILTRNCIYRDTPKDEQWPIEVDEVEYILDLNETVFYLIYGEENYKDYEQYFDDIFLEEGQTIEDLYKEKRENLKKLYIEILKYRKVKIKDEDFYRLQLQVMEEYPFFIDVINVLNYETESYVEKINTLNSCYIAIKNRYKNYEEELKAFKEEIGEEEL